MNLAARIWMTALLSGTAVFCHAAEDVLLGDFEGTDYGGWKAEGEAFGSAPAQGTLPGQMQVTGFLGKGLVNSFLGGDKSTGTLTSPEFLINRPYISFLIGGGGFAGETCVNLLVDDKVVRTATGPNTQPGGSERLEPAQWDVTEFAGKLGRIQVVDKATGGWGHISFDHVLLTEKKLLMRKDQSREIVLETRYLNLPVKHKGPKHRVALLIAGAAVREFEIELAESDPDFWVFLDISAFKGKTATLTCDKLPEDSTALQRIEQGETIKGAEDLYREKLRPQFHFSTRRGWNNDPNGLVFYKGEYHLFYQYNPYGWDWGNMHWGHAVSPDLVHWNELPIALYPHKFNDWAFSGSAVVDKHNTSGFKTGDEDVLVGAYTSTGRGECIVFSNDRGRTWSEYSGNPVVKHSGRDPKLIWHAPTKSWVMALYDETGKARDIVIYTSPDLKTWQFQSRIGGFFECPDMFELPVDGNPQNRKWVLTAASSEYMIGQFDGKAFTPETPKLPGHLGNAMYAAQTYSDIPEADGRRIQVGWGQMNSPGMPFNQMMCFPCELSLRTTPDGVRLFFQPVKELEKLHAAHHKIASQALTPGLNPLKDIAGELFDIQVEFDPWDAAEVGLNVRGVPVTYNTKDHQLVCGNRKVELKPADGIIRLQILVDRTSLEIFANNGRVYMPMAVIPKADAKTLSIFSNGGAATFRSLDVYELKSAWE